jgi:phage terminase Nu1 subunit (DNA packaging protein)
MAQLVGTDEIAKLLDKTPARIRQLADEGVIPCQTIKGAKRYDLLAALKAYIKHLESRVRNRTSGELADAKLEAETALQQAKARKAELELAELEGHMHAAADVEAMTADIVLAIRDLLLAMPGHMAVDIAAEIADVKDAPRVAAAIRTAVNAVLLEISEYRYDPDAYQRRVRERQGWTTADEPQQEEGDA